MRFFYKMRLRFRSLFRNCRVEKELSDELRFHLEKLIEEYLAKGMTPQEARYTALREIGGVEQIKEECRDMRRVNYVENFLQDARYGFRQLRRSPTFTFVAILTLALGIGANTTIFSVVSAVLLRPLPFKDPSRLIALHEGIPQMGYPEMGFSAPDLAIFARQQKSFSSVGSFRNENVEISGQGEPERLLATRVSASLFPMLGAEPMLGRTFAPEEDTPGHTVVILSYDLWQRKYGGEAGTIGRTIGLDRQPYVVIGVMPPEFRFPLSGPSENGSPAALWVPMALTPTELQGWGGSYFNSVIGRLRQDVTLSQARAEAQSLSEAIVASYPAAITEFVRRGQLTITAAPFHKEVVGAVRTLLLVLVAAVAFVLLISCANVATLLLSRAASRQKEAAVRSALGATRFRLICQMLTESLLLAFGGGVLGLGLTYWGKSMVLGLVPASVPLPRQVPINGGVLAFALAVSILTAVLFGLAPSVQMSGVNVQQRLQEGWRSGTAEGSHRLQGFFVTIEFGLAVVLLISAGLLIRSFAKLLEVDPGFQPDHVLTLNVPLPRQPYPDAAQIQGFYKQLLDRASNLPGVLAAGLCNDLPLKSTEFVSMTAEAREGEQKTPEAICQSWVLGDYFHTMGIPLLQGRTFGPEDRLEHQPVAVVSLSLASKLWPRRDPLGKRIRWGLKDPWATIVGVVGDIKEGPLSASSVPHVYRPYSQLPESFLHNDPFGDWHAMNLALRTRTEPASLASAVLAQVHALDSEVAVTNVRTMTQVIGSSVAGSQFNMILLGAFACLALFLATIGVYGVLAYAVARRTHEIGVRMALGAEKHAVLMMVLRQGLRTAGIGTGVGIVGALGLTRFLSSLLYGVKPSDPPTFVAVSALLIVVALLATYIPARRATKVDPMVALRYE